MSSGVSPSCTCRKRWPREAFTGTGNAEMSSLLLPTQTTGLGTVLEHGIFAIAAQSIVLSPFPLRTSLVSDGPLHVDGAHVVIAAAGGEAFRCDFRDAGEVAFR